MKTLITTNKECTCMHNYDSNGRDPNCPLHEDPKPTPMKIPITTSDFLDVKIVRELKAQLVAAAVVPQRGTSDVFFMVTTKENMRCVLKEFGFKPTEIRKMMKRVEKVRVK